MRSSAAAKKSQIRAGWKGRTSIFSLLMEDTVPLTVMTENTDLGWLVRQAQLYGPWILILLALLLFYYDGGYFRLVRFCICKLFCYERAVYYINLMKFKKRTCKNYRNIVSTSALVSN